MPKAMWSMTVFVRIMVNEELPAGAFKIAPHIRVVSKSEGPEALGRELLGQHKVVYCGSVEGAGRLREVVAQTEGLEELT